MITCLTLLTNEASILLVITVAASVMNLSLNTPIRGDQEVANSMSCLGAALATFSLMAVATAFMVAESYNRELSDTERF